MKEIEFEIEITYPNDRTVNRVWVGALIGGIVFGVPRFLIWVFYEAQYRPYRFDVERLFEAITNGGKNLNVHPGHFAVMIIVPLAVFGWWKLINWMVRQQAE